MLTPALFGILILDREPLGFANLPGLFQVWFQDAGGFAAVGLLLYVAYALSGPKNQPESQKARMPLTGFMLLMGVCSLMCYAGYLAAWSAGIGPDVWNTTPPIRPGDSIPYIPPVPTKQLQPLLLTFGGLFALFGIGQPFALDLFKLRFRRIWALSKVGFLEAWRSRLFWIFVIFLLPFLFPAQWFVKIKAEDELRTNVDITSFLSTVLLLLPAVILASVSIPNDIKYQTIYTIFSKPIERFELVLGRFFGYTLLMSVALALMTVGGWAFISTSKLDEKAVEETQRARMPHRGKIDFRARKGKDDFAGTNVGREFDYRKYISGSKTTSERAVWMFDSVPAAMASNDRTATPCEFTFDIFRLTKGDENRGVDINIRFVAHTCEQVPPTIRGDGTWKWADAEKEREYRAEREEIDRKLVRGEIKGRVPRSLDFSKPGDDAWPLVEQLAEKYGFFEVGSTEVYDYHPAAVAVPTGLFKAARAGAPKDEKPRLEVFVKCTSDGQMLGMAPGDLYLMEGEKFFTENYFKSAFGLWFRVTLIVGIAVTFSTYLAGIISLLATLFLYLSAYFLEHLKDVAGGTSTGGGPFESFTRLLGTDTPTTQLERTTTVKTIQTLDLVYQWIFRRYENIVPDVDAYSWTNFLKEGFNINTEYLLVNFVVMVGYLIPWAILSYYLIRNREVAA